MCLRIFILFNFTAIVSDVSATALNSTSVMVSWSPVNLAVMYYYTVNYTIMGVVNGTVTFPSMVSAGVVSGLQGGQQYQFTVTVTLNISGELYTGSHKNTLPPITCEKNIIIIIAYLNNILLCFLQYIVSVLLASRFL